MLTNALGRATKGLQEGGDADSPINGLLYVSGNITGSSVQPTGEVAVRLYDAAVGEQSALGPLAVLPLPTAPTTGPTGMVCMPGLACLVHVTHSWLQWLG